MSASYDSSTKKANSICPTSVGGGSIEIDLLWCGVGSAISGSCDILSFNS